MSTNYIAEFYKTADHDYEDFFGSYVADEKMNKINKEIKSLNEQIDLKKEELSRLYTLRYNDKFTPIEGTFILSYEPERGRAQDCRFDILSGAPVDENSIDGVTHFVTAGRKAGDFTILVGYCFPLGSAIIRKYSYKISTNNSRCSFKMLYEYVAPIMDYSAPIVSDNGVHIPRYDLTQSATEFIQKMYDLPDFKTPITFRDFCGKLENNKSTEIILRTAPEDCMKQLLDMKVDKAEPIHKILELPKAEYDSIVEKGYLSDFIRIKSKIKCNLKTTYNKGLELEDYFHYTNSEWIDILEKSRYWEEECRFNQVNMNGENPIYICLDGYMRQLWGCSAVNFYKYYSFGKFMDYVCEESCNQGFQSLSDFIKELKDYLSMCETMDIKPTLYSSYLKQTHDILARNYKIKLTEEQEELFKKRYEDFKDYKTKDGNYIITHPSCAEDVKQEGYALNHCCASYINKVIQGTSKLVFLRYAKSITKSLVTIEICDNAIVQARGASNRSITKEEFAKICEYAQKNELRVRVSPRE